MSPEAWNLDNVIEKTIAWHHSWKSGEDMHNECLNQIESFNNCNDNN